MVGPINSPGLGSAPFGARSGAGPYDPAAGPDRRAVLRLLIVAWLAARGAGAAHADERPTLYVFLQTEMKATAFEQTLRQKLPGLAITVFGRFRDFDEAFTRRRPDAILAPHPLLEARAAAPALRGLSNGEDFEPYVLVSAGTPLVGPLANRVIGVVDLMGRKETHEFVTALLKTRDLKTKLVTKLEDLLSLLQFSAADAILLPAASVKPLSERSRLTLHVRPVPDARVGLPSVAVLSPAARENVLVQFRALDRPTNQLMGVDGWRVK